MKKILIVEDDQIVANIYRNKFSVEGFQVEIALDGESGMEMVRSFQPDAVILDLMLPRLTGVDLMKKIRAEPNCEQLPVVVFSNTYLTNMVQEAWKAGATKCLSKANCTPKQVMNVVRTALSLNGSTQTTNGTGTKAQPATGTVRGPSPAASTVAAVAEAPAAAPASGAEGAQDSEFQGDLRRSFVDSLPGLLSTLRGLLQGLFKAADETNRLKQINEMYRRVHSITGSAGIVGMTQIGQMTDALEALLKELYDKPRNLNASTMRTIASSIDFLGVLFKEAIVPGNENSLAANVLVVDDEAISRRAITYALDKAKLKSVAMEDPAAAYDLLTKNQYDLVFLDVDMPGMNGFELCTKLRALPSYKNTPVVFVTSLTDFESRANSTMSGGNDFIAKPFLFMELAVKALIYVLRVRFTPAK
jgi:DNA-binding response OmpR family regulator/HPt (histidine-containing phosphotransfer) domain-containing protein